MNHRMVFTQLATFLAMGCLLPCAAQQYSSPGPDGKPGAVFGRDCVSSQFFEFSYRLPEGMSLQDISAAPNGGNDPSHKNFVLFMAYRERRNSRDVIDTAAEDRRSASDQSAASWMRALHHLNATRPDVPRQADVESFKIGERDVARLRFEQRRNDGVLTYETAYAFAVHGYVVYFILGSVDEGVLAAMEDSSRSLSTPSACPAAK